MAQTGYTPILIYSSSTASQAPAAGNLTNSTLGSELAINITDGKLFYKDNANNVQVIAWKTTPTTAGGTGLTSYTAGDMLYYASGTTLTKLAIGTLGQWLGSSGTAPQWNSPAALTKTDDTNVTLTLGGSASTALLNAASLTLGWAGQLAVTRGGTGLSTVAQGDILYGSASNTLAALAKNTTATRYLSNTGSSNNPAWAQIDLSNGVTGTLPVGNGGTGATTFTAGRILFGNTTSAINTSANLFWDNTNRRLGINTSSPAYAADIRGGDLIVSRGTSAAADAAINFGSNGNNYIYSGNANNIMAFATNGSERQRIHASGGVSIGNTTDPGATNLSVSGNVVIATSGKGIDFSATAGTGTSELLADYEEGTWTPTIASNTGTITSYTSSGTYTKTGRLVTLVFTFKITNNGTGAGFIKITNLPFTVVTGNSAGTGVEFAAVGYQTVAYAASSTQINMFKYDWTYPGGLNHEFYVTISYQN